MMTNAHIMNAVDVLCTEGFEAYYKELAYYFAKNKRDNLTYGEFFNRTARATSPLQCEKEALFYTVAYAWPHYLTIRQQIEDAIILKNEGNSLNVQVIDYGCGQGIATIAFIEFLIAGGLPKNCRIDLVLIEPSFVCLQIAQFLCTRLAQAHGISIIVQTQVCEIKDARLPIVSPHKQTLHLMSNILDVEAVQETLNELVEGMSVIPGKHLFFATSPSYSGTQAGFRALKELMPYAKVWKENDVKLCHEQYLITQNRWTQCEAKRSCLTMSWHEKNINKAVA